MHLNQKAFGVAMEATIWAAKPLGSMQLKCASAWNGQETDWRVANC